MEIEVKLKENKVKNNNIFKEFENEIKKLEPNNENKIKIEVLERNLKEIKQEVNNRELGCYPISNAEDINNIAELKAALIKEIPKIKELINEENHMDIDDDIIIEKTINLLTWTYTPSNILRNREEYIAETELGEILRAINILTEKNEQLINFTENKQCMRIIKYLTTHKFDIESWKNFIHSEEEPYLIPLQHIEKITNNEENINTYIKWLENKNIEIYITQDNIIKNIIYNVYEKLLTGREYGLNVFIFKRNKIDCRYYEEKNSYV